MTAVATTEQVTQATAVHRIATVDESIIIMDQCIVEISITSQLADFTLADIAATTSAASKDFAQQRLFRNEPSRFESPLEQTIARVITPFKPFNLSFSAVDPERMAVTLASVLLPAGSTFNSSTGLFLWLPTAYDMLYTVSVSASDGVNTLIYSVQLASVSHSYPHCTTICYYHANNNC